MTHLSEKAMLVTLSISKWTARKKDKDLTEEVATTHGADPAYGNYSKRLVAKDALTDVNHIARMAREFHSQETLPWLADGTRILPAKNFLNYITRMKEFAADFDAAAEEFCTKYDEYVKEAKLALGGMFRQEDYPDSVEIRNLFGVDISYNPMPKAADFRVELAEDEIAEIRADIENRTQSAVDKAVSDLWERAREAVQHLKDRAEALDGESTAILRKSVFENLRTVSGLLERLNMTDDGQLETVRQMIDKELLTVQPEDVKRDASTRAEVKQKADDILAKMQGYTGGAA